MKIEACLFKFDGIIFHDAKTCPNNSNSRYGMPERLAQKSGIPTLTINGDLNDLRCYSTSPSARKQRQRSDAMPRAVFSIIRSP